MEILLNLDKFMFDIMSGSGFTVLALLGILKILARETKWSGDDKILEMLSGALGSFGKSKSLGNQVGQSAKMLIIDKLADKERQVKDVGN